MFINTNLNKHTVTHTRTYPYWLRDKHARFLTVCFTLCGLFTPLSVHAFDDNPSFKENILTMIEVKC